MTKSSMISRWWSLALAIILPILEITCEGPFPDYVQVRRAGFSVVCIALLAHSWFMQRKYAQSKWRLAFLTLLLSLLAIGPLWLGLNVIRSYSYDLAGDYQQYATLWYHNLYWYVVELQDILVQLAMAIGIVVVLWAIVDLMRCLRARLSYSK